MEENVTPPPQPPPLPQPLPAPPPLTAPAVAAPRRGRGWMILALLLVVLLGFSMLLNLSMLTRSILRGGSSRHHSGVAGPKLDEVMLEENGSSDKIAVVRVEGIITSQAIDQGGNSMVEVIRAQLRRAGEDRNVKAVLLRVDSPGGEVLAADEIARAVSTFQEKTGKPVIAAMDGVAASGGYYISAPCRWIVANELTITGSIGVIMSSWNYRGLMDKVGVLPRTYKSGRFKDMLSSTRKPEDITPDEENMIKRLIDETFTRFKHVVQEGRERAFDRNKNASEKGRRLSDNWEEYADGRVLSGTEAFQHGFIDKLGNFEDAVRLAEKVVGVRSATLIEYQQRYDFADFFRLFGGTEAKSVKVNLGIEVPKLQAGRLYFLSPTYLQ